MVRSMNRMAMLVAILGGIAAPAHAQWGYPGGYGGYGWGGWGATTALGDEARGMGMFAAGAGQYNLDTSQARSINADTTMRFNEYLWESQQIKNQMYYKKLAQQRQRINESAETTYKRLRDNPETADVRRGDALNVILDEITAPSVYGTSVSAAAQAIPSDIVKNIPFQYAPQAITISLDELTDAEAIPALIKDPRLTAERKVVRAAADKARAEIDANDAVTPATLKELQAAIQAFHAKFKTAIPQNTPGRFDAENFIKAIYGLTRMMEQPDIEKFLRELDKVPTTTLAALIGFMHTFNLRFAAANTPRQQTIYDELYGQLRAVRDQVVPANAPMAIASAPKIPDRPQRAQAFFSGMQMEDVSQKKPLEPMPGAPVPANP